MTCWPDMVHTVPPVIKTVYCLISLAFYNIAKVLILYMLLPRCQCPVTCPASKILRILRLVFSFVLCELRYCLHETPPKFCLPLQPHTQLLVVFCLC